jgi:hypothetical protein
MPLNRTRTYFAALAIAALSATSATADVITTYTNPSTWESFLTLQSHAEATAFSSGPISNSLVAASFGTFFATGLAGGSNGSTINAAIQNTSGTMTITSPAGGSNAEFLYLGANAAGSGTYSPATALTVTLTDSFGNAQTFALTTGSPYLAWGFTSDTAINTITVSAPAGDDVDLADFYAGAFPNSNSGGSGASAGAAPECATLLLLGGGLIVVGLRRKFIQPIAC